ncbi:DCC1-like thiol-disulfide oxidoreductase family protein [Hyphococcus sp.]|uniref:DCC1-like thiol-disulfide oxidoreductase family protein n=1 Tax=Hyphococcus sp. TaxID=2038636 RepID=UPI003D10B8A4
MTERPEIYVVYDGECPFCSAYVRMVRLREAAGNVRLLNAREPHPLVEELKAKGYDLDEGMALKIGDAIYHGPDVMNRLALMSTQSGFLNRLHLWIFSSRAARSSSIPSSGLAATASYASSAAARSRRAILWPRLEENSGGKFRKTNPGIAPGCG